MVKSSRESFDPGAFSDLNEVDEAVEYVRYLEHSSERLRELSRARYELLNLRPGAVVLDVGCGLGEDTRELASLIGPRGQVIGIDFSAEMIAQARKRSQKLGKTVKFHVGDAHDLKFPDASFSACWSERVLQHLSDPARAIAEMVRVLKPGGTIVLFEPDYSTLVIDADDRSTTRSIALSLADSIRTPWIGTALFSLLKANGLPDVMMIPTPLLSNSLSNANNLLKLDVAAKAAVEKGVITANAATKWFADLKRRDATGRFFGCLLCFTAAAEKPPRARGSGARSRPARRSSLG